MSDVTGRESAYTFKQLFPSIHPFSATTLYLTSVVEACWSLSLIYRIKEGKQIWTSLKSTVGHVPFMLTPLENLESAILNMHVVGVWEET